MMASTAENRPDPRFVSELRRALRHLYDPDVLRESPLAGLLSIDAGRGPRSLQRALTDAIEALKPKGNVSSQSNAWRTYRTLSARYLQQFRQAEVAKALGLSIRQMRRQDSLALRVLAEHLWNSYGLAGKVDSEQGISTEADVGGDEPGPLTREDELRWVEKSLGSEPVDVGEMVKALLDTVVPLAQALGVRVGSAIPDGLPRLMLQPDTLRQALLNVLTVAIRCAAGGQVQVSAALQARDLAVCVSALSGDAQLSPAQDHAESIQMARQLVRLSEGSLEMAGGEGARSFRATLRLPAVKQVPVLVIDDNVDALQLYQRYLAGSRYAYIGTSDAHQAVAMAEAYEPKAIVLDVMLPGIDGWELLGRLRTHPSVQGVPIIVCTILPQEQLATALGAAAFLRKPVRREVLLTALDRHSAPQLPGCGS